MSQRHNDALPKNRTWINFIVFGIIESSYGFLWFCILFSLQTYTALLKIWYFNLLTLVALENSIFINIIKKMRSKREICFNTCVKYIITSTLFCICCIFLHIMYILCVFGSLRFPQMVFNILHPTFNLAQFLCFYRFEYPF